MFLLYVHNFLTFINSYLQMSSIISTYHAKILRTVVIPGSPLWTLTNAFISQGSFFLKWNLKTDDIIYTPSSALKCYDILILRAQLFFLLQLRRSFQARGWIRAAPGAYTTAKATPDPSHICDLHCSLKQYQILKPLSKARVQTHILTETMSGP